MFSSQNSQTRSGPSNYIEDAFSTYMYTGTSVAQTIRNGIALSSTAPSYLAGLPITVRSGNFDSPYVIDYINDGAAPNNNSNFSYSNTSFDIYVTYPDPVVLTEYLLAPQGNTTTAYNAPTGLIALASNDASTWTTLGTFTGVSGWLPGTFKTFAFSNTTAYKYWRLYITGSGSEGSGNSVTEWRVTEATDATGTGGMVWTKCRSNAISNIVVDSVRGGTNALVTDTSAANSPDTSYHIGSFNSNGYSIQGAGVGDNASGYKYVSWTFRKQPKFFDIVTWTGNGTSGRTISHNLGSVPGCIVIKCLSSSTDWTTYHRSLGATQYVDLNRTAAADTYSGYFNNTEPTSTVFSVGNHLHVNSSGQTYVAYLFAHDAGGFGLTDADNVISCGTYTGTGTAGLAVSLGYEPQWVMIKRTNGADHWCIEDTMRGMATSPGDTSGRTLFSNLNYAEYTPNVNVYPTATGFVLNNTNGGLNASGGTYIYVAIRKGPMKVPTDATKVFSPVLHPGTGSTELIAGFPPDLAIIGSRDGGAYQQNLLTRLCGGGDPYNTSSTTGAKLLAAPSTAVEVTNNYFYLGQRGFGVTTSYTTSDVMWNFKRAPSFFDVVCVSGSVSSSTAIPHNLGATPELIIAKTRTDTGADWAVYSATLGKDKFLQLNTTGAQISRSNAWGTNAPTATNFSVDGTGIIGANGVFYLFATCPGVSKVGSFTNTGSTINIDCGFTGGARFVMCKRTNTTGGWFVYDTARGINAGTDPGLAMNSTAAEYQITDDIDTYASGFTFNGANWTSADYIFLAIA